jgi:hypothetical protein
MKTNDQLLKEFRIVLEAVGYDISSREYEKLVFTNKPSRATLEKRFGKTLVELKEMVAGESLEKTIDNKYLVIQNKTLLRQLEQERNKTKIFVDNCLAEIGKVSFKPFPVPIAIKTKDNLDFHAMRSDAQVGEKTEAYSVQGIASYNIDIYKKRLAKWVERIKTFKEQDKGYLGLNKLVIHHLGDQVEGEGIFKGQSFYLDASLLNQLFISVEQEASALISLAQDFTEIEVYTVDGNHGRPAGKGENHHDTNFDRIFYLCLKKWCEQQPNIKIYVSESPTMLVQHGDFIFALNHSDSCKSWNGIPFYGLERMVRRLPDLYGMLVHYYLGGHHHQSANITDKIIMNGCFPGGSDLAINRMAINSVPSQKIFYFHPRKGINRETNIYLDEPVKLKADSNGIFTSWK